METGERVLSGEVGASASGGGNFGSTEPRNHSTSELRDFGTPELLRGRRGEKGEIGRHHLGRSILIFL
jgi:hypothetical protein